MRRLVLLAGVMALLVAASTTGAAAADKPLRWHFDTGYSGVAGNASDALQGGWTLGFGAAYAPRPQSPISFRFDVSYDWWDVNTGDIDFDPSNPGPDVTIDDGDVNQWSVRAGIMWESHGDSAKLILGAGIGGYREYAKLSNFIYVPGYICDPWYWWYCYPGLVPGEVNLADKALTKFGYYASIGVAFPLTNSEIYLEAQYHWVNVESLYQTYPIVVGWRW
jgi:opacity protein-like surface antigen